MTREHLWPQWLSRGFADSVLHMPYATESRPLPRSRVYEVAEGVWVEEPHDDVKKHGGSDARRVIKAACSKCNNGWMSALELLAQPVIIRQFERRDDQLTAADQRALLRWLAKTSAIYEMDDPRSTVLPMEALSGLSNPDFEFDERWRFEALWTKGRAFRMGHLRRYYLDPTADMALIADTMTHVIQIRNAVYLIHFRSSDRVLHPELRGVRRQVLGPSFEPARRRPIVPRWRMRRLWAGKYHGAIRLSG